MSSPMRGMLMLVTILLICCTVSSYNMDSIKKRTVFRRQRQRQMRSCFETSRRKDLSEVKISESSPELSRFFREEPSAKDIDCKLQMRKVTSISGQCRRLEIRGKSMAVCESGEHHVAVQSEECRYKLSKREINELFLEMTTQQPENGVPNI